MTRQRAIFSIRQWPPPTKDDKIASRATRKGRRPFECSPFLTYASSLPHATIAVVTIENKIRLLLEILIVLIRGLRPAGRGGVFLSHKRLTVRNCTPRTQLASGLSCNATVPRHRGELRIKIGESKSKKKTFTVDF